MEDSSQIKTCSRCNTEKQTCEFNNSKTGKYGKHNHCRDCQRIVRRLWYDRNREHAITSAGEYSKTDAAKNSRRIKYHSNKEEIKEKSRAYSKTEAFKTRKRKRDKARRDNMTDAQKIELNQRKRISRVLKGTKKQGGLIALFGCTVAFLMKHLESTWKEGMNWDNYGTKGWHVDHILPCTMFDFSIKEEQERCFHYTNLQALWWWENIQKRAYIPNYDI